MSATVAGKFQDHYSILGVDPKANSDVIQTAYAKLAERYRKDNKETGDPDKFDSVNQAFEVLCDPALRAEFDKIKGIDQDDGNPQFSGLDFFTALGRNAGLRAALLSILYDCRQKKPFRPALSMRHIDSMLVATNDELSFALWYLKQRGLVQSDDKSNLQITVEGMDSLEGKRPAPELVMPFIKPAALTAASASLAASATATRVVPLPAPPIEAVAEESDSVLTVLNRALARR
jgi:curved DNA-binding protein CbpA